MSASHPDDAAAADTAPPPRIALPALRRVQRRLAAAEAPWLHREVATRMGARLDLLKLAPTRVIDWWSHTGAGKAELTKHYPKARHVPVEPAVVLAGLPAAASRPWWRSFTRSDAVEALADDQPVAAGELLWSNMMLHWCADLRPLLSAWHAALQVDGMLMFSCLGPDTLAGLRRLYLRQGWGVPASNFVDMHDLGDALVGAGFGDPVMDMEMITLTWDSPAALLAELRGLGSNTAPARATGLHTPRWQTRLEAAITEQLAGPDGRVRLSFEIIYGHAIRAVARAPVKASTEISLQSMREMTAKRSRGTTP
jgi:malonyl-CoA O-methyltransferase